MFASLALAALLVAQPTNTINFPNTKPAELTEKIANYCMNKGGEVTEMTSVIVRCQHRRADAAIAGMTTMNRGELPYRAELDGAFLVSTYNVLTAGEGSNARGSGVLSIQLGTGRVERRVDEQNVIYGAMHALQNIKDGKTE